MFGGLKQSFSKSVGVVLSNWRAAKSPRVIPQSKDPAEKRADSIKMVFSLMAPPLWEMKRQLEVRKEKKMCAFLLIFGLSLPNHEFGEGFAHKIDKFNYFTQVVRHLYQFLTVLSIFSLTGKHTN